MTERLRCTVCGHCGKPDVRITSCGCFASMKGPAEFLTYNYECGKCTARYDSTEVDMCEFCGCLAGTGYITPEGDRVCKPCAREEYDPETPGAAGCAPWEIGE